MTSARTSGLTCPRTCLSEGISRQARRASASRGASKASSSRSGSLPSASRGRIPSAKAHSAILSASSSNLRPHSPSYAQGSNSDYINAKSLEVISSKIDALRAAIDSMNARLANIERIAGQEEDTRRRRYY